MLYLNVFDFIVIDFANKKASSWLIITSIRCHSHTMQPHSVQIVYVLNGCDATIQLWLPN